MVKREPIPKNKPREEMKTVLPSDLPSERHPPAIQNCAKNCVDTGRLWHSLADAMFSSSNAYRRSPTPLG